MHAAPDEGVDSQSRVIRVPGGGDKHVNIIFVKTPRYDDEILFADKEVTPDDY